MKIKINKEHKLHPLGDLFGIFFEDINHAADGGLYGELIRNRGFEFCATDSPEYNAATAWESVADEDARAYTDIHCSEPYRRENPHYLVMDSMEENGGIAIRNEGYNGGIPARGDMKYDFSCCVHCDGRPAVIEVSLENKSGDAKYCAEELEITNAEWAIIRTELSPSETDYEARLAVRLKTAGRVYLDNISLFPRDVFNNRPNGLRRDIAEKLKELKPKFMRFPGGCLVHTGSLRAGDRDSLYRWKNTIGDIYSRPSRKNNWGYNQSLGLGYYEYFLLCEDIGAKPLPVLPAGYDPHHDRRVPFEQMDEWIKDALDLIEFANGSPDTEWGRKRCELGHEKPFGLEYIGIGNEEIGEGFFERYPLFHKAIKEKYPDIKLINSAGPFVGGAEFKRGWRSAAENGSDLIDEHYYLAPEWFIANHHHYDRKPPFIKTKVFLGEYASWGNTWFNALAEASYMIGLERNADKVGLACYAPLLCNVDYVDWKPDMIWFDNHRVCASANYYVQKLFMNNQGDTEIESSVEAKEENEVWSDGMGHDVLLSPQAKTAVRYTNIRVTDGDRTIEHEDVILKDTDAPVKIARIEGERYRVSMDAEMLSGIRGFKLWFDCKDEDNKRSWEIGGWQNTDCAVCEDMNGRNSCLDQRMFVVKKGVKYSLMLDVTEEKIAAYVSEPGASALTNKTRKTKIVAEPIYCCASEDSASGDTIIKLVNVTDRGRESVIETGSSAEKAEMYVMSGYADGDENTLDAPDKVVPRREEVRVINGEITYYIPARSLAVIRIKNV